MKETFDPLFELGPYLPKGVRNTLQRFEGRNAVTEIRLRRGQPLALCCGSEMFCIDADGRRASAADLPPLSEGDLREAWQLVTSSSVYALEEELKRGYITLKGGHRVGIAGTAVRKDGAVKTQKDITSFNYRCARELKNCGLPLLPLLVQKGDFQNTLIFSPPACGKTTLLRDLTRLLSEGSSLLAPRNITVVDERGEIAAVHRGDPRYDLGPFTDILSDFPKSQGMMLALRSLAPSILVTDEIGSEEDRRAVDDAVRCGVKLLLTAHGGSIGELRCRPILRDLLKEGVFHHLVTLGADPHPGTVIHVYLRKEREGGFYYVEDPAFSSHRGGSGLMRHDPCR